MALEREDRDNIHRIILDLMREVTNMPKLTSKQKEVAITQLRFLEQEINKDKPHPLVVHNSIEDFEKSFPWLKEKLSGISAHPHVRALVKEIRPKKRFFFF